MSDLSPKSEISSTTPVNREGGDGLLAQIHETHGYGQKEKTVELSFIQFFSMDKILKDLQLSVEDSLSWLILESKCECIRVPSNISLLKQYLNCYKTDKVVLDSEYKLYYAESHEYIEPKWETYHINDLSKIAKDKQSLEESKSSEPKEKTLKDTIVEHEKCRTAIAQELKTMFSDLISESKFPEKELNALAETITRIPLEEWERSKSFSKLTPEALYSWALPRSSIVFPYLTLKMAGEEMNYSEYSETLSWGIVGKEIHIPKIESISNSNIWMILRSYIMGHYPRELIKEIDPDETVPKLDNDQADRDQTLQTIIIRLLELAKSPASATIRRKDVDQTANAVKNQVDFVVLDSLYQASSEEYKSLGITGFALSQGRRSEKVPRPTKTRQVVVDEILTGYRLAQTLCKYVPKRISKNPESEPFVRLIIELLQNISKKIDINKYQLPGDFLMSLSSSLRQQIRRGPIIKKSGSKTKENLYMPFTFVKSAECADYPKEAQLAMTETGSDVNKNIDQANKLPPKEAVKKSDFFKEYIKRSYLIADQCRNVWKKEGLIPNFEDIKNVFGIKGFPKVTGIQIKSLDEEECNQYLKALRDFKLSFKPLMSNPDDQAKLMAKILKVQEEKKKKRSR